MNTEISALRAREVLDSRGKPTVEVEVATSSGATGRAIAPSGASTGAAEALELRDSSSPWYDGLGVGQAVANANETIARLLIGRDAADQSAIDAAMIETDGTPNKASLGANAILAASLAVAHAAAAGRKIPLYQHINELYVEASGERVTPAMPLPMINMISGGLHAGGNLDFQDVLMMPVGADRQRQMLEWTVRVYWQLGRTLKAAGYEGRLVGDEGGYGPALESNRQAVDFVLQAVDQVGLRPGDDVSLALDVAASHFFDADSNKYQLAAEQSSLDAAGMIDRLEEWCDAYPIESIEDGLAEDDWDGWRVLNQRLGDRVRLVGDDLFATNPIRVQRGIELAAANAVLIKVNQIGTLTETMRTMTIARRAGFSLVVSARSGETEDFTIADLAVGTAAEQIKIGSVARSERLAKYNQLIRLAELLEN